jgi:hypothetical protein
MTNLYPLERAVLEAIARQVSDHTDAISRQPMQARVVARKNYGCGLLHDGRCLIRRPKFQRKFPIGDVSATVDHLQHGMGFLLWLKEGRIHELEGYSYAGETTSDLDFERVHFEVVGPHLTWCKSQDFCTKARSRVSFSPNHKSPKSGSGRPSRTHSLTIASAISSADAP